MAAATGTRYSPSYISDKEKLTPQDSSTAATEINTGGSSAALVTDPDTGQTVDTDATPDWRTPQTEVSPYTTVRQEVIDAILAGVTINTRRIEIYEADGTSIWNPSITPRIIEGSVSVSQGSDSRRNLDLTLDNSDGKISHNPDGGLWYDKIIKVYRGVKFEPVRKFPKVAVVGGDETVSPNMRSVLGALGITDITFIPTPPQTTFTALGQFDPYDIVAAIKFDSEATDFSDGEAFLLNQAYAIGKAILTINNFATSDSVPLISNYASGNANGTDNLTAPNSDTPFNASFTPYSVPATAGATKINDKRSTARTALFHQSGMAAVYEESGNGGRWFHYHERWLKFPDDGANATRQNIFLAGVVNWLFNFQPISFYETQIGEFMIDRISEANFPRQIQITGRDYSKKLDLDDFIYATTWQTGDSLETIIRGIIADAGIVNVNINTSDDRGNPQSLSGDYTADKGTKRLDAIKDLCTAYTLEWYFDFKGTFIVRPFLDPATSPTILTLKTGGTDGNLVSYTKISDDTEMYNVVRASNLTGGSGNEKWVVVVENDDPNSPTSTVRVGRRVYSVSSTGFRKKSQVQRFANAMLKVKALEAFELDFESLLFPWFEAGVILGFIDPDSDQNTFTDRLLLTDITFPLTLGPMSGTGKRVVLVPTPPVDDSDENG